jgi:hypothetical protein
MDFETYVEYVGNSETNLWNTGEEERKGEW